MPRKPPPRTGCIKPGETRNRRGSSEKARKLSALKRLTADEVSEVGSLILTNDRGKLNEIARSPTASVLQVWTAALVVKSIQKGDVATYAGILDRIVGKVKDKKELSGPDGGPVLTRAETTEEKVARIEELRRAREDVEGGRSGGKA